MARAPASSKTADKSAEKSERAFRTISEAAETIGVPQHVLRFWETRFPQLQPLKRGGNRRYYRPADMALLETIRAMLHDRGLTIRGARLALEAGEAAVPAVEAAAVEAAAPEPAFVEPDIAAVPIVAPVRAPNLAVPSVPAIDIAALAAIRDRLRYALAA
ncbi:MAG: MerR family transcriptional regulator [Polymorphobacter sp.]